MAGVSGDGGGSGGAGGNGGAAGGSAPFGGEALESQLRETLGTKFNVPSEIRENVAAYINTLVAEVGRGAAVAAAAEARRQDEEKRKKREERRNQKSAIPVEQLSPGARERRLRKQNREELKRLKEVEKLKEEKRKQMPMIVLNAAGGVEPSSYYLFKSELQQIIKANFRLTEKWTIKADGQRRTEEEKAHVIEQVRDRFQNGSRIPAAYIVERIHRSLSDKRNHQRVKIRKYLAGDECVTLSSEQIKEMGCPGGINPECWTAWVDEEISVQFWLKHKAASARLQELEASPTQAPAEEIALAKKKVATYAALLRTHGNPPAEITSGIERAEARGKKGTHKLGQGGKYRLQAEFVSRNKRKATPAEVLEGIEHGSLHVHRRLESELAEDNDEELDSSEDEAGAEARAGAGEETSVGRSGGASRSRVADSLQPTDEEEEEEEERREVVVPPRRGRGRGGRGGRVSGGTRRSRRT